MIFKIVSILLKIFEGHRLVQESKKKGLVVYLKFLQALRTSLVGALFVLLALQMFVFAVIGLILAALYLAPIENETKAWALLVLCGSVVLFLGIALLHIFSEKTWFKYSGVKHLISK